MLKKLGVFILFLQLLLIPAFSITQSDLVNTYCHGQTPCYICSNGEEIRRCTGGSNPHCTLDIKLCDIQHSVVLRNSNVHIYGDGLFSLNFRNQAFRVCLLQRNFRYSCINVHLGETKSITGFYIARCERANITYTLSFRRQGNSFTVHNSIRWDIWYWCYPPYYYVYEINQQRNNPCLIRVCVYTYTLQQGRWVTSGNPHCSPYRNICEERTQLVCPYGNYECFWDGGLPYCSPHRCYNAFSVHIQNEDTIEGAGDLQNNGQITQQGCIGNIYIFNGHDYRCRPPGIETGFSNCCKKHWTWFGLGRCSERERILADLRNWGQLDGKCHYIGSYCSLKVLGVCVQKKKTFCCFSSPLARIIQEQGRRQLGISWGSPKHPNCRGFTPEEFQRIDFSRIDFSEWINYEVQQNIVPNINTNLQNALNNLQSAVQTSIGGQ